MPANEFDRLTTPGLNFSWGKLLIGFVLTVILSLGVHEVMTDRLAIPYPTSLPRNAMTQLPEAWFLALGSFVIYPMISGRLGRKAAWVKWTVLALLLSTLKEGLIRAPVMDMFDTGAFVFPIVKTLPQLLYLSGVALLVCFTPKEAARGWWLFGASLLVALLATLLLRPAIKAGIAPLLTALSSFDSPSRFQPPYDYHILIPAYLTFVEPVMASFVLANLIWNQLPHSSVRRLAAFTLIVFFIRGPVAAPILNIFFAKTNALMAVLSVAQFSFESVLLGLLTACAWSVARKDRVPT